MLTLPERLLLISIDQRGRPRDPTSSLGYALAGAALTELLLAGRLRHDHGQVVVATASLSVTPCWTRSSPKSVLSSDPARSSGG
jgi:Golgi phosphoprotein 3 (GPP34)